MTKTKKTFHESLQAMREKREMSRMQLCQKAGISYFYLCHLERGTRSGKIGLVKAAALSAALDWDLDEMAKLLTNDVLNKKEVITE